MHLLICKKKNQCADQRMAKQEDEVAFFHLVRQDQPVLPLRICGNDPRFHPDYAVRPIHVIASFRRMTNMYQRKYVDAFGRKVDIDLWGFPRTLCQAIFLSWFIRDGLIHRVCSIS